MDYFNQSSERLIYRKLTEADIPDWLAFFEDNDRLRFLAIDLDKGKSKQAHAEDWIRAQFDRYETHGIGHLAVTLKDTGVLVGLGGIIPRELLGKDEFEIAYSLIPQYWGMGYATELALTMKAYGKQHVDADRFISIIEVDNVDSARVAVKNGMSILFKTQFMDMNVNVYGVTNK